MKWWLIFLLLSCVLMQSCSAFQASPLIEPPFLRLLCEYFQDDPYFEPTAPIFVIPRTQPLFELLALNQTYSNSITNSEIQAVFKQESLLRDQFQSEKIRLCGSSTGCNWTKAGKRPEYYSNDLVLEIGPVIENPYADHSGLFIRRSLGGMQGASWFWIEIHEKQDGRRWYKVMPLDISDG